MTVRWGHPSAAAPEHHLTNLLRVSSVAPDATAAPDAITAWQANVRRIADAMWAEAWHAGAARGLALHVRGACYTVVTEQQYEQIRDADRMSEGGGKPCRPVPSPADDPTGGWCAPSDSETRPWLADGRAEQVTAHLGELNRIPLPEPDGLVFILIEVDEQGESVGRYWPIENPSLAAHLQRLASHTGPGRWQVTAHFGESNRIYVRVDPGVQPPTAEAAPEQP